MDDIVTNVDVVSFDNNAGISTHPKALARFVECQQNFINITSNSNAALKLQSELEECRQTIKELCSIKDVDDINECYTIIFTSGGTESNAIAIKMIALANPTSHIVTSSMEHSSIIDNTAEFKRTSYIDGTCNGEITTDVVSKHIKNNTRLVSIMYANNEFPTINDVKGIGELIKDINKHRQEKNHIIFHTDATQMFGKERINIRKYNIDMLTFSGYKIGSVLGIGGLIIRNNILPNNKLYTLINGKQQKKLRGGTINYPAIFSLETAIIENFIERDKKNDNLRMLRNYILDKLRANFNVYNYHQLENKDIDNTVKKLRDSDTIHIINFEHYDQTKVLNNTIFMSVYHSKFCNIKLRDYLETCGFLISFGSACRSLDTDSKVLKACNISAEYCKNVLRISLSDNNTMHQVEQFVGYLVSYLDKDNLKLF